MKYIIFDKYDNTIPKNKPWKNGVITKQWKTIKEDDIFFFPNEMFSFKLLEKVVRLAPIKSSPNRKIEFYIISAYDINFEVCRDKIFNKRFCRGLMLQIKKNLLIRMLKTHQMKLKLPAPVMKNMELIEMKDYDLFWYIEGEFNKCETMDQVKKKYKEYARLWHPDNENGDERIFSIITSCYTQF